MRALIVSTMRTTATRRSTGPRAPATKSILCVAAFGTLSGSSWAFVTPPPTIPVALPSLAHPPTLGPIDRYPILSHTLARRQQPHRLYFSQKDDSDWSTFKKAGGNLLKKGANKIRNLIPFGKSEEERQAAIEKKERKEALTGGISAMLKNAPLPIRMMGRMVGPLMARAAEGIQEQAKEAQDMLEEARLRLANDPAVSEQLGEPLQVGQPFSQSSSTMVINGQTSARVRGSFQVAGPRGSGVATMESSNGEITSLTVNVNGRNISVGSSRRGNVFDGSSSSGKGSKKDDFIEAEIIEKK